MKKRIFTALLALAMIFTFVPSVHAEGNNSYYDQEFQEGGLKGRDDIINAVKKEIKDRIIVKDVLRQIDKKMADGEKDWQKAMKSIDTIDLPYNEDMPYKIEDLNGIQLLEGLKYLNLRGHDIREIAMLSDASLKNLNAIDLSENENLEVIAPLGLLDNLEYLYLGNCTKLKDISPLVKNTNMISLKLYGCAIEEIAPLSKMTKLTELNLYGNKIEETGALTNLSELTFLDLGNNAIEDLGGIEKLYKLESLNVSNNKIEDIGSVYNLTALTHLNLSSNKIEDVTPLKKLSKLTELNIADNNIVDKAHLEANLPENFKNSNGYQTWLENTMKEQVVKPAVEKVLLEFAILVDGKYQDLTQLGVSSIHILREVEKGYKITAADIQLLNDITKGFTFGEAKCKGYFLDKEGTVKLEENAEINEKTTIHMIWETDKAVVTPDPEPEKPDQGKPAPEPKPDTPKPTPSPEKNPPKTGDENNAMLYASLAGLALVGGVIVILSKKREELMK